MAPRKTTGRKKQSKPASKAPGRRARTKPGARTGAKNPKAAKPAAGARAGGGVKRRAGSARAQRPTADDPARRFAVEAARSLDDDKCADVLVLEVRGRSPVTDYIVIATGSSDRQMRSVASRVADIGPGHGHTLFRSNKDESAQTWIVLDFVDVVVHVFEPTMRSYYDLEMLWGDSPRVDWRREAPARPARRAAPAA